MAEPTLFGLISRGYFPKELPPAFNTRSFAKIARNPAALPKEFTNPHKPTKNVNHSYLARANSRRRLGIVNPIDYVALSISIINNWKQLRTIHNKTHVSLTSPVYRGPPNRAFGYKYTYDKMDDLKAKIRSRSRYLLRADISQYYHSIYTHSIAWVIHGKKTAKLRPKDYTLLGNILDMRIRHSQDNQTVGIPIGPDASFIVAETILSICDEQLHKMGIKNYTRYIDDYEFGCESLQIAERYRGKLQEILSEFELVLNPDKTKIIELPITVANPCISYIRTYELRDKQAKSQRYALISIFDNVFQNLIDDPDVSLIKYLLGKIKNTTIIEKENWTLYENLLLQCIMSDPSTISYVLDELLYYQNQNYPLNISHIKHVMSILIETNAPINHGSEVAWALWTHIALGITISIDATKAASKMNDSVVAILLLDAISKNLIKSSIDLTNYISLMTTGELYGDNWLLSYEANVKNWLSSYKVTDHVKTDKCFNCLKTASVEFYDDKWLNKNKPFRPPTPWPYWPGGGGDGGGY